MKTTAQSRMGLLLIFLLGFLGSKIAKAEPMVEGQLAKVNISSPMIHGGRTGVLWEKVAIDISGTEFFRVKFGEISTDSPAADVEIQILDRNYAVLEKYALEKFQKGKS